MAKTTGELPEYRIKGMGWRKDQPDPRDRIYAAPTVAKDLPRRHDLRSKVSGVFDQGNLGSCTANAIAAALRFIERKQGEHTKALSRLFIYFHEREIEGTVNEDSGAQIRDGIKVVAKLGAPPEEMWSYDTNRFAERPPKDVYDDALHHEALTYARVPRNLQAMKACLVDGFPFVIGFAVFESFYNIGTDGIAPIAGVDEPLEGWHAVLCVGYDDTLYGGAGGFWFLNSWGHGFGKKGYFAMPYHVLLDPGQSDDFWTIRSAA